MNIEIHSTLGLNRSDFNLNSSTPTNDLKP